MSQQFRVATDGPEKQTRHEHKKVRRHWNLQPEHPELSSTTHQAARQGSASGGLTLLEAKSKVRHLQAQPGRASACIAWTMRWAVYAEHPTCSLDFC